MFLQEKQIAYKDRCPKCYMRESHCICADIPQLNNKIPLTIVMHAREVYKTTNTGRLANLSLVNSRVIVRGDKQRPLQTNEYFPEGPEYLYLTLSDRSELLTSELVNSIKKSIHLVVPDGNWRQASKMGKRETALQNMRWIKLPVMDASRYQLRHEHNIEGLATIEAIARAYGILESPKLQEALEEIFLKMVRRTLATRAPIAKNLPRY